LNTLIGGVVGGILAFVVIFGIEYWQNTEGEESSAS
jgi:hypothetical protein